MNSAKTILKGIKSASPGFVDKWKTSASEIVVGPTVTSKCML